MIKFFIIFIFCLTTSAWAYIPPATFMIKKIIDHRETLKFLKAITLVEGFDESFEDHTFFDAKTGVLKSFSFEKTGTPQLYFAERRLNIVSSGFDLGPISSYLVFGTQLPTVIRACAKKGFPIRVETEPKNSAKDVTFLKRWNSLYLWVIGSAKDPQLWIEKDKFILHRIIFDDEKELQYKGYKSVGGIQFPHEMTYLENQKTILNATVSSVLINQSLKSEASKTPGFTEEGRNQNESLKKLIELYYTYVR